MFLFVVEIETDLSVLWRIDCANALAITILLGAIGSKLVGGFVGAKWTGHDARVGTLIAVSSTAKLAVPLSATYAARDPGILDQELFSAIVIAAAASSILGSLVLASLRPRGPQESG